MWVLTAAHCLFSYNPRTNQDDIPLTREQIKVTLGTLQLKSDSASFREVIAVSQIITHEAFVSDTESEIHHARNDIALLRLSKPSHMDPADKLADRTNPSIEE